MKYSILKTYLLFLFCIVAWSASMGLSIDSSAQIIEHQEYAAEIMATDFGDVISKGGLYYVKRCDQCATEGVSFSPATRFYEGKTIISQSTARALEGKGATLFFNPKTKLVTRVVFWK